MDDSLLNKVAWIGETTVRPPIQKIVLRFSGLGGSDMKAGADGMELEWGQAGALVVTPYHNPWAWMNPAARAFVDELLDGIKARHRLPTDIPVIATGCSMGGQGVLIYTRYARHLIAACVAISPVCDLPYHYTERPDLPRTMHDAFGSYGNIDTALEAHSPYHQTSDMPDIPYLLVHGDQDRAVNKEHHSDQLAAEMSRRGLNLHYYQQAGMGHCGPYDWPLLRTITDFVLAQPVRNAAGGPAEGAD